MSDDICQAIDSAADLILNTGGHVEPEYMSASKYRGIRAVAEELGVSFDGARNEWARRKIVNRLVEMGENPEDYDFKLEIMSDGFEWTEMLVARKRT